MSRELDLIREKAARMTNGELANEIVRVRHGMTVAATKSAAARFERRLILLQEEADARMSREGLR